MNVGPKNFKPVTHVVFDLDGTLIDTVTWEENAINEVSSRYGMKFTLEHSSRFRGNDYELIVKEFQLPITVEEFRKEVQDVFTVLMKNITFMPGAEKIIQYFRCNHIPLGLCTGSLTEAYNKKVKYFGDFFTQGINFDVIVVAGGGDADVTRNKPDPQPYLVTIDRFPGKPKAENVLVFEDSFAGVTSAIAAGTQCVMIPDHKIENGNATSQATVVIDSLNNFNPLPFSLPPMCN